MTTALHKGGALRWNSQSRFWEVYEVETVTGYGTTETRWRVFAGGPTLEMALENAEQMRGGQPFYLHLTETP